ncbi:MAG: hypothetical protein ACLS6R_14115 [Eggerthella lenta]|jgi:hypothetical protein
MAKTGRFGNPKTFPLPNSPARRSGSPTSAQVDFFGIPSRVATDYQTASFLPGHALFAVIPR